MTRRGLGVVVAVAALSLAITQPAASAGKGADAPEANRHVNLSALQSMLAEQIAKAACFAALEVNATAQRRYMAGAYELFSLTHLGLRGGNSALGLAEEVHPNMLQALDAVERESNGWRARVTAAIHANGALSDKQMLRIVEETETVLPATNALAERASRTYGATAGESLAQSLRIKLASRQRLLSQKIAKDFCLIAQGHEVAHHRAELNAAIGLFDASMNALIDGFAAFGLAAEANPTRRAELEAVRDAWNEIRPALAEVAAGAAPDAASISTVAWGNNVVLTLANAAVFSYETDETAS
ncbi:MAG: type IV pili methyl-accepting chemotaxis transducer N-terminal domain-containing protein [Pseudomonadota bacterium]